MKRLRLEPCCLLSPTKIISFRKRLYIYIYTYIKKIVQVRIFQKAKTGKLNNNNNKYVNDYFL